MEGARGTQLVLTPEDGYTIVSAYREAEEILRRQDVFVAQGGRGEQAVEFVHDTLIDLDGEAHAVQRRLLTKAVSPGNISKYEVILDHAVDRHLGECTARQPDDGSAVTFDLVEFSRRIFWHFGARMVGIDDIDGQDRLDRLEALAVPALEGVTVLFSLKDHDEVVRVAREASAQFRNEFYLASRDRRLGMLERIAFGGLDESELPADMLSLLLRAHPDSAHDAAVMRQCLVVLGASVSSTVSLLCHGLAELEAWLKAHPEDTGRIQDHRFIARLMDETIRLHRTGSPYTTRRATAEVTLVATGRRIAQDAQVAVDLRQVSRDPVVFGADADRFNLDREVSDHRAKGYGLGFGAGPHICLAKRMIVSDHADQSGPRILDLVLARLLRAGVWLDPDDSAIREPHGADRFSYFPVAIRSNATPSSSPPRTVDEPGLRELS
jgi:cytochrome P450